MSAAHCGTLGGKVVQRLASPTSAPQKAWVKAWFKMAAQIHGSRKFYDIPREELSNLRHRSQRKKKENNEKLLRYIEENCIGKDLTFSGPYGQINGVYVVRTNL